MFSKGQIIFALLFFLSFVIAMYWSYSKDKAKNKDFFKGSYKVILFVILVFIKVMSPIAI